MLPLFGLIAVILYRSEHEEPERRCPTCNKILKLHVQVCPRCGTDLYLPDPSEVPAGPGCDNGSRLARPRIYRSQVRTIAFAKPRP